MEKLPTIDDITHHYFAFFKPRVGYECPTNLREMILEFTKLHVTAALKAASEQAELTDESYESMQDGSTIDIDKDTILTAYPLTNIK